MLNRTTSHTFCIHPPTHPPVTIANGNNRGEACVVFAREQIEQLLRPLVAFHFQPLSSARSFESSITICSVSQHNIAANYHATCCFAISYTPCFGEKVGHCYLITSAKVDHFHISFTVKFRKHPRRKLELKLTLPLKISCRTTVRKVNVQH